MLQKKPATVSCVSQANMNAHKRQKTRDKEGRELCCRDVWRRGTYDLVSAPKKLDSGLWIV